MPLRLVVSIALMTLLLGGCATQPPQLRVETKLMLDRAQFNEAAQVLPDDYARVVRLVDLADSLFQRGMYKRAEDAYRAAWIEAKGLERRLYDKQMKRTQESLSRTESELLEVSRQRAMLEEQRRLNWEEQLKQSEIAAMHAAQEVAPPEPKPRPQREVASVTTYTVKRGESLPQIASRPEVYGDTQLWPLIYRSNRDQISDPRRIWPGQVLRIPRNLNADDLSEARRHAQKSQIF